MVYYKWRFYYPNFTIPIDFGELNNEFTSTPKKFELNPYITNNNKTQITNTNTDDELPDENEIYQKKNSKDNNYTKPGDDDDNNQDGDAPPPSAG